MPTISIQTTQRVIPMIYAYTTPEIARHDGWTKIGYTERDVQTRIKEQLGTARIAFNLEWTGEAVYNSEPRKIFHDTDFHAYLQKLGIIKEQEWFKISGETSQKYFQDFKDNRGVV